MTAPLEPIDPMREGGIRLWHQVAEKSGSDESKMIGDLLLALDRQRIELQSLRTALSVHERRPSLSKSSAFTSDEEGMLKFALDTAQQVVFNRSSEFSEADTYALACLREWANGR